MKHKSTKKIVVKNQKTGVVNTPKYGNNPIRKTQERKKKEKQPCKNPTKPTQHKCSSCNNKKSTPNTHTHTLTCMCLYLCAYIDE